MVRLARSTRLARLALLTGGVVVAGMTVAGCGSVDLSEVEPERQTFAITGRTLTVDTDNSEIELVPGDGRDVKVTRWFDGWSVGGSVKTTWAMEKGDVLKLRQNCDGISVHCEGKHRVEVPRGVRVIVKDENGGVTSRGIKGDLRLESKNGDIDVHGADGRLDLSSDNGDLRAEDGIASRLVSARSKNGDIAVRPARVPERVSGESTNGDVTVRVPAGSYRVDASSRFGRARVGVPRDGASPHVVAAHSRSGDVTVRTAEK
ncbi:DUF4097 family beta strand repeat protein [Streptomyces mobaraensis NBRC 13819 = DSM 40847]|uniref:Lipoprotein n=1 Tax=Streptomyces mobaraensis (strain ATCC 29032 / DSM 40847 / JCM 4168 / NBRC 13819 / NCIMB 11159 / IPCR 16-22) TaxID=1223523 RepID=M3C0I4_STRM1|nr:DUF4097 family beta strand repeat-containing protein [Streptomyces mobaraensis]EME97530.1 lipoprotein [Streptomyces mobaraensis NBRC 13819 = DSM 40847]QTT73663.1 DUF4097 family beta strand repeat protein [Streptomyces mobaraensis NBRC 13819 = DSM 40847]